MSEVTIVTAAAAGAAARRRLLSSLARGETVEGVFFYADGIEAAADPDERHAWQALARRHRVPLILCAASARRRGLAADGTAPDGFELAGIDRFAALAEAAGRIDVAGRS